MLQRIVPVVHLVVPAGCQHPAERRKICTGVATGVATVIGEGIDLGPVVAVDEIFHGFDGAKDGAGAEQRGQSTGQPARQAPQPGQPAAFALRHESVHDFEMSLFRSNVVLSEFADDRIAGHRQYAPVDFHRAGFAGVIGSQFPLEPGRPAGKGFLSRGLDCNSQRSFSVLVRACVFVPERTLDLWMTRRLWKPGELNKGCWCPGSAARASSTRRLAVNLGNA